MAEYPTEFSVREGAPAAVAVMSGHAIVDTTETRRLTLLPNQTLARAALCGESGLQLEGAWCKVTPGEMKDGDVFQVNTALSEPTLHQVSGWYAGPGSELTISPATAA